jgi:hypothetical protein
MSISWYFQTRYNNDKVKVRLQERRNLEICSDEKQEQWLWDILKVSSRDQFTKLSTYG